ncbi:hypothetical protein KC318_g14004 [Hortaea werneckii]|uniref:Phenazine biosynthesis protein n=1 Tax=Hortaea werneckii TaxID=91943 RepID=A0A3M7A796_HORWE|nr:hypothetical protein KC334_g14611 [Hortaea werneckii]KAI6937526.1 hypothetical protein KC355_g15811 [Hortaea werneckii]KAI7653784.1 hypothetical protein KC318_g14004 [Hortaea werneckii]RMY23415.1 hypothetical protein D0867_02068 [Hortaea werneckii]RMY39382.1 hypothetical protein D0866_01967 [Hortaea werneckii]
MPSLPFVTLDVFTIERFKGNPLGLIKVPQGQDVSSDTMQMIAREFNLSESVFLYEGKAGPDGVPEWRYRIFMTEQELPFAGHPTIGTAVYALGTLAGNAKRGRMLCNAGPVEVEFDGVKARCAIPHNFHVHQSTAFSEPEVFELQPSLKSTGAPVSLDVVSPVKGMNFICVELKTLGDLARVELGKKPSARLDAEWNEGFIGSYFYVVTKTDKGSVEVQSRMIEGQLEDPATGSAACGLACLLATKRQQKSTSFQITQGVEMGRRSDIGVDVTLSDSLATVERVELSGSSVKVMEGNIEYN